MYMKCNHEETIIIRERCFTGSVGSFENENRRAHGGVTFDVECKNCGAQRSENINGLHEELGTWSESRAERIAAIDKELREIRANEPSIPASITLLRGEERAIVECDTDGMLVGVPDKAEGALVGTAFLTHAKTRRKWFVSLKRMTELRAEI